MTITVGDNIIGGHEVKIVIDETTGHTKVYIPAINGPSPDPVAEYDPSVTFATIEAIITLLLDQLP